MIRAFRNIYNFQNPSNILNARCKKLKRLPKITSNQFLSIFLWANRTKVTMPRNFIQINVSHRKTIKSFQVSFFYSFININISIFRANDHSSSIINMFKQSYKIYISKYFDRETNLSLIYTCEYLLPIDCTLNLKLDLKNRSSDHCIEVLYK